MAKGRRRRGRKGTKRHHKARRGAKGHVPLKILEKRLDRLNSIVRARGGSHY